MGGAVAVEVGAAVHLGAVPFVDLGQRGLVAHAVAGVRLQTVAFFCAAFAAVAAGEDERAFAAAVFKTDLDVAVVGGCGGHAQGVEHRAGVSADEASVGLGLAGGRCQQQQQGRGEGGDCCGSHSGSFLYVGCLGWNRPGRPRPRHCALQKRGA